MVVDSRLEVPADSQRDAGAGLRREMPAELRRETSRLEDAKDGRDGRATDERREDAHRDADPDSPTKPEVPPAEIEQEEDAPGQVHLSELPDLQTIALLGLLFLAVIYTMRLAHAFLVPIALSVFLDFLLSPVIRRARRIGIPTGISAALVMTLVFGTVGLAIYNLAGPAATWIERAPQSLAKVEKRLAPLRPAVEDVKRAAEEVQSAAALGDDSSRAVEVAGPSLVAQVFGGTMDMFEFLGTVAFLTFFLLAAGDFFLLKLIRVLPHISDRKKAVNIARTIESEVSTYMVTTTLINLGVGVATAGAMWLCEMPNPIMWGVVAAVLNFIPYVGGAINAVLLMLAALLTFDSLSRAMMPPAAFLLLNIIENNYVQPYVLGKRLQLNNVAVFVGMLFWAFIWGIPGVILAVPMLVVVKIIADNFEQLSPISEFLGE